MKSSTSFRFSSVFFFILFIVAAIAEYSNAEDQCAYSITIKTGTVEDAGTDSRISLSLSNGLESVTIPNLKGWGVMLVGHDYFKNGNIDFFVVEGDCLPRRTRVCNITVTSDGTSNKPGWYLEYVGITTIGPNRPRERIHFRVYQWLAVSSAPYQLSTTRDRCGVVSQGVGEEGIDIAKVINTDFVVRTWE